MGPKCAKREGPELTQGGFPSSCCLLEETFNPTKKEAISQEVLTLPKLSPINEEPEIVNLDDHNMELPISINPLLMPPEKKELVSLLKEYHDVFSWQYEEMLGLDPGMVAHALNIEPGAKPVVQPRRIFHPDVEARILQEVKNLLATRFIKPIEHQQWLPNIVPMKKKNRKIKCYVNFRDLTRSAQRTSFLSLIWTCLLTQPRVMRCSPL